eukprot:UN24532
MMKIREQFRNCFKDHSWLKNHWLHDLIRQDGWIYMEDLVKSKAFKKVSSIPQLCHSLIQKVLSEYIARNARYLEILGTKAIRRKFIHIKVMNGVCTNFEQCVEDRCDQSNTNKWTDIDNYLQCDLMVHTEKIFKSELGKRTLKELVYISSRYSRILEFNKKFEVRLRPNGPITSTLPQEKIRKLVNSHRKEYKFDGHDFRIISYNVLADSLLDEDGFPWTTPETRDWTRRRWRIVDSIWRLGGSLCCLQEVQQNHKEFFATQFETMNFNVLYTPKT